MIESVEDIIIRISKERGPTTKQEVREFNDRIRKQEAVFRKEDEAAKPNAEFLRREYTI